MKTDFSRSCTDRTRAISFNLKDRFRLEIRKKFPMMRVVKCWIAQRGGRYPISWATSKATEQFDLVEILLIAVGQTFKGDL